MTDPNNRVSENLKSLRAHRKWSLTRAAEETGVSKAMLGQIERGESSPTIATLWKIASGFDLSLSSLLGDISPERDQAALLFRDAATLRQPISDDGMLTATLFPYDPQSGFEFFELTFPEGYARQSVPHKPGVTEYITVLKGEMSIEVEGVPHQLSEGQALRFAADRPHGYRNEGAGDAVIHCLIRYPEYGF